MSALIPHAEMAFYFSAYPDTLFSGDDSSTGSMERLIINDFSH